MGAMSPETSDDLGAVIFQAAYGLIAEHGASFTTQDVIKRAGVSLQTFYRYYGGKDQLMIALLGDLIRGHVDNLVRLTAGVDDPVARLELYVRSTLGSLEGPEALAGAQFVTAEHWRLNQRHPQELSAAVRPFTDLIAAELEAGRAAGRLAPRDPARDALLMTLTILGAYHHYAFVPDEGVETLADDVWAFCRAAAGG